MLVIVFVLLLHSFQNKGRDDDRHWMRMSCSSTWEAVFVHGQQVSGLVQVAAQVVASPTFTHKHTHHHHQVEQRWRKIMETVCVFGVLRSKKQEMVGLLTPNVVVTDLSSFLSSMLLCGRKRRRRWRRGRSRSPPAGPSSIKKASLI